MNGEVNRGQTARAGYQIARTEAIERVKLRDQAFLGFMAAIGALFGLAYTDATRVNVFLTVPYLAFGVAAILAQHNAVIASLGKFCVNELEPFLRCLKEDAPQWESSDILEEKRDKFALMTFLAQMTLIIFPCLGALAATFNNALR